MKVGEFLQHTKSVLQIEKATQVHQLLLKANSSSVVDGFLNKCVIRVWNNKAQIIPPMHLGQIAVLNGDEYRLQVAVDNSTGDYLVVLTYEVCDEGSINKTVYVELDNQTSSDIELDSIDILGTTAVSMRLYNFMNVVSPMVLPKNSICVFAKSDILSLQKNNDLMGEAEIYTHSNEILISGVLSDVHPYVDVSGTPTYNAVYQYLSLPYAMGSGSASGSVIISTGNDEFILSPVTTGCALFYCQKEKTVIAQQVETALAVEGQLNNVDSSEFAMAVGAVGRVAELQNVPTTQTQVIANRIVRTLPSVVIARNNGVKNYNAATERELTRGLQRVIKSK